MEQAARDDADLLMIDTAGRLQNRADLMEELQRSCTSSAGPRRAARPLCWFWTPQQDKCAVGETFRKLCLPM
jgi:hypothetical protein